MFFTLEGSMSRRNTSNNSFPWWYSWIKWMLPLTLAVCAGALMAATLTGAIAVYEAIQWAPLFFATLEGFSATAVLTLAVTAAAALTGVGSSLFIRAGLFHVAENIATRSQEQVDVLTHDLQEKTEELQKIQEDYQKAFQTLDTEKENISKEFYQLKGYFDAINSDEKSEKQPTKRKQDTTIAVPVVKEPTPTPLSAKRKVM